MSYKKFLTLLAISFASVNVQAAEIDTSFVTIFGCAIYNYLTGPISTWAFVIVVLAGIVMGLFHMIDWGKIVVAVITFAVVQSLAGVIVENPTAAKVLRTASCLSSSVSK